VFRTMKYEKEFPNLAYLLSCYYHQDWLDEWGSESKLISHFAKTNPAEMVSGCVEEIGEIIKSEMTDEAVLAVLSKKFRGENLPYEKHGGVRLWLKALSEWIETGC